MVQRAACTAVTGAGMAGLIYVRRLAASLKADWAHQILVLEAARGASGRVLSYRDGRRVGESGRTAPGRARSDAGAGQQPWRVARAAAGRATGLGLPPRGTADQVARMSTTPPVIAIARIRDCGRARCWLRKRSSGTRWWSGLEFGGTPFAETSATRQFRRPLSAVRLRTHCCLGRWGSGGKASRRNRRDKRDRRSGGR
jgi:NAD(P)-binding Rossmann-like domain